MAQKRILSRCSARWRDPSVRFYVLSLCSWSRPHVSTSPASPKTRITWGYVISSMSFIPRYTKSMQVRVWHLKRFVLQWRHTSDILITSSFIKTIAYVMYLPTQINWWISFFAILHSSFSFFSVEIDSQYYCIREAIVQAELHVLRMVAFQVINLTFKRNAITSH